MMDEPVLIEMLDSRNHCGSCPLYNRIGKYEYCVRPMANPVEEAKLQRSKNYEILRCITALGGIYGKNEKGIERLL